MILVNIASSAVLSRRDNAPPAHWAHTRRAQDPSPAWHAAQAAKLASIRADAAQLQGPHSVRAAPLPREVIATRDPRTVAQRREPHARLGISALVERRTSKFARSRLEGTVLLDLCQRKGQCVLQDSGAGEVQTTRLPVPEAHILLLKAQHLSQRAPTALGARFHQQGLLAVLSASLEQWLPPWAW